MRTALVTVAAAAVAGTISVAFAASVGVGAGRAAGGAASVVRCDTDGFTVSYGTDEGDISNVTVAGIGDPGCEGATVRVTATSSAGASLGSGTGPVPTDAGTTDNSLTVSLSPRPSETSVVGIQIAMTGP